MRACADIEPLLSAFVDDDLPPPGSQAEVQSHIETCDACGGIVSDLRRLRASASSLGPIEPPAHVWLEVAGQIQLDRATPAAKTPAPVARDTALWQWIGLAAALVLVTFGLYVFEGARAPVSTPADNAAASAAVEPDMTADARTANDDVKLARAPYDKVIAELEGAAGDTRSMDTAVAEVMQQNIGAIDRAIDESQVALTVNPDSEPARDSLFDALRRKIAMLQATVTLINEMRVGNQDGAAAAAESMGRKS